MNESINERKICWRIIICINKQVTRSEVLKLCSVRSGFKRYNNHSDWLRFVLNFSSSESCHVIHNVVQKNTQIQC